MFTATQAVSIPSEMELLLKTKSDSLRFPKTGDLIEGTVLSISRSEVLLDIEGLTTGVVRGRELDDESGIASNLKLGERATATVVDAENERGEIELSFRQAGHQKAWDNLEKLMREEIVVEAKIVDANKGGLMVKDRKSVCRERA